jgi:hypothetical protein
MRRRNGSVIVVIACILLGIAEAWYVFVRETPAVSIEGQNRRVIEEFGRGEAVLQLLNARKDLASFEIRVSTTTPTTLFLQCDLLDIQRGTPAEPPTQFGEGTRVAVRATWAATLAGVSGVEWRRIAIPRVDAPDEGTYAVRLRLVDAMPASGAPRPHPAGLPAGGIPGVALIASKDNVLGGGAMWIGERRQLGSVSLHVFTGSRTAYERFRAQIAPRLPRPLGHPAVVVAIAVAYQCALAAVVYALLASRVGA